jgi:O-antigen/teichoic acid export membrane protein
VDADTSKNIPIRWRVVRSTLSNYAGQFVTLIVGFILTPFIINQLGVTSYGLWVLVGAVVAYGTLFDFGIWATVIKYVAEYRARGESEEAHHLVATALTLHTLLGLAVVVITLLLAPVFPKLFNVPPADQATATALVMLSGLGIGISIPSTTSVAVLCGLQRFDLSNLISAGGTLLTGIATVVVLLLGGGVVAIVAVGIPLTLLMQIPSVWLVYYIAPDLKFGWKGAQRSLVRKVVSFGSPLFIMQVSGRLQNKTDEIVIGAVLPVSAIAPYSVARRLSEWASLLANQFVKVLLPLASELHVNTDWTRLRSLYLVSTRLTLAIYLPIGCAIVLLARPFLTAWVGPAFAASAPLVGILTLSGLIDASQWPAGSVLQGTARHHWLAVMSACSAVLNLVLSIFLAQRMGVAGVALGTLIPTALIDLGLVMPYAMRVIGVGARDVLRKSVMPALLPVIPTVLFLLVIQATVPLSSLLAVIIAAGCGMLIYLAVYVPVSASEFERQTYRSLAVSVFRFASTCWKNWRTAS